MIPVEEKPPPVPNKNHLQLQLELQQQQQQQQNSQHHNHVRPASSPLPAVHPEPDSRKVIIKTSAGGVKTTLSSESSVSSISSSDVASSTTMTPTDKPKPKLLVNGTKHASLKRVSFGSSKGSMVETLIYESPLQEEPEASPILEGSCAFPADGENAESEPSKKVRVTFFESEKPSIVTSPEPSDFFDDFDASGTFAAMTSAGPMSDHAPPYARQNSTDSGWDNPFRPDGDLSREADEIVEMIKGGKPITPTPGSVAPKLPSMSENDGHDQADHHSTSSPAATPASTADVATTVSQSAPLAASKQSNENKVGANGNAPCSVEKSAAPGAVEVQRGTVVPASDASQIEHVVIKKKPKCKCCVIQ